MRSLLTATTSTAAATASSATPSTTASSTAVASHLMQLRVNLLLRLCEYTDKFTSLLCV